MELDELRLSLRGKKTYRILDIIPLLEEDFNIGMFVPCDLQGNILEYPKDHEAIMNSSDLLRIPWSRINKSIEYDNAKERVLFKGFKYVDGRLCFPTTKEAKDKVVFGRNDLGCFLFNEFELTDEAKIKLNI